MNFDPRSDLLNTEFGVLIWSPALAAESIELFDLLRREASYRVQLKGGDGRNLQWVRNDGAAGSFILEVEPGSGAWTRIKLYLQSLIVPESLL